MHDGCEVYMDSYMASNGSCFTVTWIVFKNHLLEVGLTQKTGRPWHSVRSQQLVYFILSCVRTRMNRYSLKQNLVEDLVTYNFTLHLRVRDHTTWFWRCLGTTFGHFLMGPHNFMVTTLGSCVKWPQGRSTLNQDNTQNQHPHNLA